MAGADTPRKQAGYVDRESSAEVAKNIGGIARSMFSKLKSGVVQMVNQAALKAKRLVEKFQMNNDEIKEILETEYMDSMAEIADGNVEPLAMVVELPESPSLDVHRRNLKEGNKKRASRLSQKRDG